MCHSPVTFSTTGKFYRSPMFHSQCFKHSILCLDFLPLFPIDRSDSAPCPFIRFFEKFFHVCQFEVIYPSSHELLLFFLSFSVAHAIISVCQFSDFVLHLCDRLRVYSKSTFPFVPIKGIAKVFDLTDVCHPCFLPIYF